MPAVQILWFSPIDCILAPRFSFPRSRRLFLVFGASAPHPFGALRYAVPATRKPRVTIPGHPFDAVRLTRVRGVQLGRTPELVPDAEAIQNEGVFHGGFAIALKAPRLAAVSRVHVDMQQQRIAVGLERP
jgi:hypothetical protein